MESYFDIVNIAGAILFFYVLVFILVFIIYVLVIRWVFKVNKMVRLQEDILKELKFISSMSVNK